MKLITTVLLLISCTSFSQVKVQAEDFAKASGILIQVIDSGIVGVNNSYADYTVSIPKSGTYYFDFAVSNRDGQKSVISVKTPTGKKMLASMEVPEGGDQIISTELKLTPTTKKIRLVFSGNGSVVNYFNYGIASARPKPSTDTSGIAALKTNYESLKKTVDSLIVQYDRNRLFLDGERFKKILQVPGKDSVVTIIDKPQMLPRKTPQ
jgi:hypothetical protein